MLRRPEAPQAGAQVTLRDRVGVPGGRDFSSPAAQVGSGGALLCSWWVRRWGSACRCGAPPAPSPPPCAQLQPLPSVLPSVFSSLVFTLWSLPEEEPCGAYAPESGLCNARPQVPPLSREQLLSPPWGQSSECSAVSRSPPPPWGGPGPRASPPQHLAAAPSRRWVCGQLAGSPRSPLRAEWLSQCQGRGEGDGGPTGIPTLTLLLPRGNTRLRILAHRRLRQEGGKSELSRTSEKGWECGHRKWGAHPGLQQPDYPRWPSSSCRVQAWQPRSLRGGIGELSAASTGDPCGCLCL